MLKSDILGKLHKKNNNLNPEDVDLLFEIFIKKITDSLKDGKNVFQIFFMVLAKFRRNADFFRFQLFFS